MLNKIVSEKVESNYNLVFNRFEFLDKEIFEKKVRAFFADDVNQETIDRYFSLGKLFLAENTICVYITFVFQEDSFEEIEKQLPTLSTMG